MDNMFNGLDAQDTWGLIMENVITQLGFQMPARKESLTVNLPDANGENKDLENPKFNPRQFAFRCVQSAATPEKLLENFRSFFTFFQMGGSYQLYNSYLNATAYLYYVSQSPETGVYENSEGGYSVRYTLNFSETDPLLNIPTVYLVDDEDRILIP